MLVAAFPVLADTSTTVTGTNMTTGASSTNTNTYGITESGDTTDSNVATAVNAAKAWVETGNNSQSQNTTGGSLTSGMINGTTAWDSMLNTGAMLLGYGDIYLGGTFTNDTTGFNSTNTNTGVITLSGDMTLANVATIVNRFCLDADTGDNSQSQNTTAGNLTSGDITAWSSIFNLANNDASILAAYSPTVTVNSTSNNHLTGANSTNTNTTAVTASGDSTTTNVATLTSSSYVDAETGNNSQSQNTTAGSLTSGSIAAGTTVINSANNGSSVGPTAGSTTVTGNTSNDTTGSNSTNTNTVAVTQSGDTTVTNVATADTTSSVDADTGDNSQSQNTSGGDVTSGDVSIDFGVINDLNN